MAETSIAIPDATLAKLAELARWHGVSLVELLAALVDERYDRAFWKAVNAGYADLRNDSAAWTEFEAERNLLDCTLADGLDREQ